jgi:hypothetical protein
MSVVVEGSIGDDPLTGRVVVIILVPELGLDPSVNGRAQAVDSTEGVDVVVTETSKVVIGAIVIAAVVARDPVASEWSPSNGRVGTLSEVVNRRHEVDIGVLDRGSGHRRQGEGQGSHKSDEGGRDGDAHFVRVYGVVVWGGRRVREGDQGESQGWQEKGEEEKKLED